MSTRIRSSSREAADPEDVRGGQNRDRHEKIQQQLALATTFRDVNWDLDSVRKVIARMESKRRVSAAWRTSSNEATNRPFTNFITRHYFTLALLPPPPLRAFPLPLQAPKLARRALSAATALSSSLSTK